MQTKTLDSLGSFATADGQVEAICWTHRGDGWSVNDYRGEQSTYTHCRTKREAQRLFRNLVQGR